MPVLEVKPALKTQHSPSYSFARTENSMRARIAGMIALFEDALIRLHGDAGQGIESCSPPAAIRMIQTVVDRSVSNALRFPTFEKKLKHAVQTWCSSLAL